MKKCISVVVVFLLLMSMSAYATDAYPVLEGGIADISKYGNLTLTITSEQLLGAGYEHGDVVTVSVDGVEYQMPLCTNYSDVDLQMPVLRDSEGWLTVALNMGDFATTGAIATKVTNEDSSYSWQIQGDREMADIAVSIAMAEKGAYRNEYLIRQLVRTNERADYASDEVFANFRMITGGSIAEGVLFRSSSPVNNELGRAAYADDFAESNGIYTVMNLADNNELIEGYIAAEDFASNYYELLYKNGRVIALNLSVDFMADGYKASLAEGLKFFAANEGPYLVHCTEGKDRAGFVSALLSCFMGVEYEQIVADYMRTYENYYHLEAGSEQYEAVKNSNIVAILENIAGVEKGADLAAIDLAAAAREYILSAGVSEAEADALWNNLAQVK